MQEERRRFTEKEPELDEGDKFLTYGQYLVADFMWAFEMTYSPEAERAFRAIYPVEKRAFSLLYVSMNGAKSREHALFFVKQYVDELRRYFKSVANEVVQQEALPAFDLLEKKLGEIVPPFDS